MRIRGTFALATALLALGAGTAHAELLSTPSLPALDAGPAASGTNLDVPEFTRAEIRRAAKRAIADGAKPRKLRRPEPAWFTPDLKRELAANGVAAAPADAPLPGQVGIRPGAWMISPYWCTMNFIFRKSSTIAIGTAGHCIDGKEPVTLLTLAPTGGNPVLVQLGRVLLKRDAGIGKDYALVEVPPARRDWVFPTLAGVGGPCGIFSGTAPQPVAHYGHGVGVGTGGTPRAGMGFSIADPKLIKGARWDWNSSSIVWAGLINGGDSGSGVRIGQLPAVSNLTHGIGITGLEPSAIAWGTRVTTITSSGWKLVSSPLCV